jgi:hypothetical protein
MIKKNKNEERTWNKNQLKTMANSKGGREIK